jgi:hypothetical protein
VRCPQCHREMRPLFVSQVGDYCDGLEPTYFSGYVVLRRPLPSSEDVFPTREDAERWRSANGYDEAEIREVKSEYEFRWHSSRGSLKDLTLADRPVELFPDRRLEPAPHRAFLA